MYALRYLPGAQRFFKKLKEKGLKEAFRRALHHIAQDPMQENARLVTWPDSMATMSTTTRPIMRSLTASMKRMVNWWWSSWPARERIFMNS